MLRKHAPELTCAAQPSGAAVSQRLWRLEERPSSRGGRRAFHRAWVGAGVGLAAGACLLIVPARQLGAAVRGKAHAVASRCSCCSGHAAAGHWLARPRARLTSTRGAVAELALPAAPGRGADEGSRLAAGAGYSVGGALPGRAAPLHRGTVRAGLAASNPGELGRRPRARRSQRVDESGFCRACHPRFWVIGRQAAQAPNQPCLASDGGTSSRGLSRPASSEPAGSAAARRRGFWGRKS